MVGYRGRHRGTKKPFDQKKQDVLRRMRSNIDEGLKFYEVAGTFTWENQDVRKLSPNAARLLAGIKPHEPFSIYGHFPSTWIQPHFDFIYQELRLEFAARQ